MNMSGEKKKQILEYYNRKFDQFGKSPKALDWGSQEVQERRFEVLLGIGSVKNCKVLDVGCGLGDMYAYIKNRGFEVEYVGYDINPRFIEHCRENYPDAKFEIMNIQEDQVKEQFDYIFTSGMFNVGFDGDLNLIGDIVRTFYNMTNMGTAVNFTSTLGDFQSPNIDYYDPSEIVALAKTITRDIVLRHDYLPHDFTLYLYKKQ
jgi:SAM-dependent methyltransferase